MPGAYQNTLDKIKSINIDYKGSQEQSTTHGNPSFITDNLDALLALGNGPQGARARGICSPITPTADACLCSRNGNHACSLV